MAHEALRQCPVCSGTAFTHYLQVKDFTTSGEEFSLQQCTGCRFLVTNPRPDQGSIRKYYLSDKYISHTGSRKTVFDRIYSIVRSRALVNKYNLVSGYCASGKILDYGCGTGELLHTFQKNNWITEGVEPSQIASAKAAQLLGQAPAKNLEEVKSESFDVITLWHVLEHVHSLNETLTSLVNKLGPNSTLFIAVPNHESHDERIYKEYWAGYDVPRHLWHFSKENMHELLTNRGLKIAAIEPMKFDSYYVSLLSEEYKNPSVSALTRSVKAFRNGLISNLKARHTMNYSSLIYIAKRA